MRFFIKLIWVFFLIGCLWLSFFFAASAARPNTALFEQTTEATAQISLNARPPADSIAHSALYGEWLGSSPTYSINYEYRTANNWAFRIGLGSYALPITITRLIPAQCSHYFEIGGGVSLDIEIDSQTGKVDFIDHAILMGIVGYRYHPAEGIFFGARFAPLYAAAGTFGYLLGGSKNTPYVSIIPWCGIFLGFTL